MPILPVRTIVSAALMRLVIGVVPSE